MNTGTQKAGVHKFLFLRDRASKKWVPKTKVYVQSRNNLKHFSFYYLKSTCRFYFKCASTTSFCNEAFVV